MKLTVEKVILLKATDFFSTIEDDILAEVATTLVEQTAAPGERIIEQGGRDSSLFLIVSGTLRVHNGATVLARVGDLAALDPDVRTVSVTADEETSLLRMDHSTLMDLIEEHTEVAYGIIRFLVRRFRTLTAALVTTAGAQGIKSI
jgi:CRP-like cAMP-binding protein